jgi:hypothetical protein
MPSTHAKKSAHRSSGQAHNNNAGILEIHVDDCPLVQPAYGRKILKQFEETGKVAIHLNDWIRFFDALAFLNDGGRREIFCAFAGEYLVFSNTPFKKKPAPRQQDLFIT